MSVSNDRPPLAFPTQEDLRALFHVKYGSPEETGWSPRMRWRFGYFTPADVYEALLAKLITEDTRWLDVGCGRNLFPDNEGLARELADRCKKLVGVDPDETIEENEFVHERHLGMLDDFETDERFDLVTMNMVAEHVTEPDKLIEQLANLAAPGGRVVVYTVFKWSPVPIVTKLTPHALHHKAKMLLWRTDPRDTFPVANKMNTRKTLARLFEARGYREGAFAYLDDCRSFARFKATQWTELAGQRLLRGLGLHYPEVCLLGVYERT